MRRSPDPTRHIDSPLGRDESVPARFRGTCALCADDPIERGEMIVRVPSGWAHEVCAERAARDSRVDRAGAEAERGS